MTDFTSTPFLRQFKKDCEELHAKLARDKAVAETDANAPGDTSLVSGASAEPNHQPHAVSQGWRDDMENAPHNVPVLLAWQDWRDGQWCMEIGPAIMGQRYANGHSSISHHGSATHWQPRPAPPIPENTPRDSSESTTGGAAPDHTTMEARGR